VARLIVVGSSSASSFMGSGPFTIVFVATVIVIHHSSVLGGTGTLDMASSYMIPCCCIDLDHHIERMGYVFANQNLFFVILFTYFPKIVSQFPWYCTRYIPNSKTSFLGRCI